MDLSKLSDDDLRAIQSGDMRRVSQEGLQFLSSQAGAAAPPRAALVEDPGAFKSALIGAGATANNVLDGLTQMWLAARGEDKALEGLKQNHEARASAYEPLQKDRPMATAVGESLPAMAIPAGGGATLPATLSRLAAAGAVPGALEYGTPEERAKRALGGAAAGVVGGTVIPRVVDLAVKSVVPIARTVRAVVEPLTESGRANIVGRTLNNAAGQDAQAVAQRMAGAAPLVPGSIPTAGQVAENGGIAALERSISAMQPADFTSRAMEQAAARSRALASVAGDDAAVAAAKAARSSASGPLYKAAAAKEVPTDEALMALLGRPSVQKALGRASNLAKEQGRTFGLSAPTPGVPGTQLVDEAGNVLLDLSKAGAPAKITGQTLQDIKMAMDALLKDPTSGIAGAEAEGIKATRGALLNWMENNIPELRAARTSWAAGSKPINQMQIGQALEQKLQGALGDHGALASETGATFARALRDADQLARTATGFKGAGMADTLTPEQMGLVTNIAKDLARKANAQTLGRGAGSDTVQKLAMSNIAERSGAPGVVSSVLNMPGVNRAAKFLYSGADEQIQTQLARALLDPAFAAQAMARTGAKPVQALTRDQAWNLLTANPSRASQFLGGLGGLAVANEAAR